MQKAAYIYAYIIYESFLMQHIDNDVKKILICDVKHFQYIVHFLYQGHHMLGNRAFVNH